MPVLGWRTTVVLLAFVALAGFGLFMRSQRDQARVELATFKEQVAQAAEAAAAEALKHTIADEKRKEDADAENARIHADDQRTIASLRDERDAARRRIVPPAPAGSKCPDGQACFDRAILEQSLRDYRSAIRGLVDEGSAVTVDLDTAKKWAQKRN